ncbi:hypothetical protein AVEN_97524-1 [Araneus ventricosus]|uniref:Uncharacterized protein n=1 Tax=Araneus ventricosus TaxID=182803 RepID=A0A4Y2KLT4_ARAVE|nr:hypothetical protein AVEN_97524-1 [Araneus ventricosus]
MHSNSISIRYKVIEPFSSNSPAVISAKSGPSDHCLKETHDFPPKLPSHWGNGEFQMEKFCQNPTKPVCTAARELEMLRSTAHRVAHKKLRLYAYKGQLLQALKSTVVPFHIVSESFFCTWVSDLVSMNQATR